MEVSGVKIKGKGEVTKKGTLPEKRPFFEVKTA